MSTGYAYKGSDGHIAITTVSESERAAKVNALTVHAGIPVSMAHTDEMITSDFDKYLSSSGSIVQIEVSEQSSKEP